MFELTCDRIKCEQERLGLEGLASGGVVFFEGRVRNHNEGYRVKSLEYQCYEAMAIKEGKNIVAQALGEFELHFAKCIHRYGHLELGEVAVWVGVSSSHRKAAFEGCRYIIDRVKLSVPIWKKEHYLDRPSEWVACHACGSAGL